MPLSDTFNDDVDEEIDFLKSEDANLQKQRAIILGKMANLNQIRINRKDVRVGDTIEEQLIDPIDSRTNKAFTI